MNMSRLFIERPIMTTLVCFAILLFGFVAFRGLPVAALPAVDYPTIQVSAFLPGASPETMATSVATPLERQFSTIAGIESMTSSNSQSSTNVTIQFNLTRNIDAAAQDVQAAISSAAGRLPPNMPRPPSYQKVNPAHASALHSQRVRGYSACPTHLDGQRRFTCRGLRGAEVCRSRAVGP
jgi:HAE1 family hydrophobic/amphiphilic exporter-1